jgi:ribonuclease P protein component
MLRFSNRFHGRAGIKYVYRNGTAHRNRWLTCKVVLNQRRNRPRVAVVVSKKVLKSAVGRNRIRRRLYEILRLRLSELPPQSDLVVIVGSAEVRTATYDEVCQSVDELLAAAGLNKAGEN